MKLNSYPNSYNPYSLFRLGNPYHLHSTYKSNNNIITRWKLGNESFTAHIVVGVCV